MKVLVTGAAGFIGSHTCERLVALGHEVVGVDCFDDYLYPAAPKRRNAKLLTALDPQRFTLVEANICDEQAMGAVFERGIDTVCHLAALAGVRPSLLQPLKYIHTNLHGTTVLLEQCRAAGVDRFVFASSSSVYGMRGASAADLREVSAFRETDPCLTPASPYAATKRSGELICSTYRDLFGIGASCLRFFTVYGPRQRPDMAIHKFMRAIDRDEPITLFGDGSTRRDYTFIDDIVSGVTAACERIEPNSYNIYNLGGTQTTSLAELVSGIDKTMGKTAQIRREEIQPGDVLLTYADITNAKRDLDYTPKTPIDVGLRRFWDWYQSIR